MATPYIWQRQREGGSCGGRPGGPGGQANQAERDLGASCPGGELS